MLDEEVATALDVVLLVIGIEGWISFEMFTDRDETVDGVSVVDFFACFLVWVGYKSEPLPRFLTRRLYSHGILRPSNGIYS